MTDVLRTELRRGTNYKTNYSHLNYNDMKEYRVTCDLSKSKNKNQEVLFGGFIVSLGNISKDIEVTDNYPLVHIDTDDKEKMKAIKLFVEFWEKIQTEE